MAKAKGKKRRAKKGKGCHRVKGGGCMCNGKFARKARCGGKKKARKRRRSRK